MHLEVLVEDLSGKVMVEALLPRLLAGSGVTHRVISYKGLGVIPKGLRVAKDARKRILLDRLPGLLRGYGRAIESGAPYAVAVLCDLDERCLKEFRDELLDVLHSCSPRPPTRFCIAVEEGEAWLLGDRGALLLAYPQAKRHVINEYEQDSICGTWEVLAEAVFPGGHAALSKGGFHAIGAEKSKWAAAIAPHIDFNANQSPSFQYFCQKIRELADQDSA